jgi:hypothetical protein
MGAKIGLKLEMVGFPLLDIRIPQVGLVHTIQALLGLRAIDWARWVPHHHLERNRHIGLQVGRTRWKGIVLDHLSYLLIRHGMITDIGMKRNIGADCVRQVIQLQPIRCIIPYILFSKNPTTRRNKIVMHSWQ